MRHFKLILALMVILPSLAFAGPKSDWSTYWADGAPLVDTDCFLIDRGTGSTGYHICSDDIGTYMSKEIEQTLCFALSGEAGDLVAADGVFTVRAPFAFTLNDVRASVTTAPVGSTIIIDINEGGTTVLSTKLTIDASEKTSTTAAAAAVISDASIADDAILDFDISQIGSSTAGEGVKVCLYVNKL